MAFCGYCATEFLPEESNSQGSNTGQLYFNVYIRIKANKNSVFFFFKPKEFCAFGISCIAYCHSFGMKLQNELVNDTIWGTSECVDPREHMHSPSVTPPPQVSDVSGLKTWARFNNSTVADHLRSLASFSGARRMPILTNCLFILRVPLAKINKLILGTLLCSDDLNADVSPGEADVIWGRGKSNLAGEHVVLQQPRKS